MLSKSLLSSAAATLLGFGAPNLGFARDWFVLPAGAGGRTGASWEQAADAGHLQGVIDQLQAGDRVLLGSGEYQNLSLSVKNSGAAGKPITIQGQDRGSGLPILSGKWDLEKPEKGPTAIGIGPTASHVVVRDLLIRNYTHGVRSGNPAPGTEAARTGWRFINVDMDHLRHGFYLSGFTDLKIEDCDLKRYSKHGFRLDAGCVDVTFTRCSADCSEGDATWEDKTEAFPFGFSLNDGGAPNRNVVFDSCIARNHMMPLQKGRYKNGDGFVVEGNSENVSFKNCRSVRNQDGGYDLKVKDVKLDGCVAIGNKRNFRIWTTGRLTNCFSGWSNENIWTKGGPIIVENSTIVGWKHLPAMVEDSAVGVELSKCLIAADGAPFQQGKAVKMTDCVQVPDLAAAGLTRPPETWDGKDAQVLKSQKHAAGFQPK